MSDRNITIEGFSAPYPVTTLKEMDSKKTFDYVMDSRYIKPDLRVLDKVPNTDGTIEITNDAQVSVGKLEVQLKTLDRSNLHSPKYQCHKSFIAYCRDSTLAVILAVADIDNNCIYWRHIDEQTIADAASRIKGETVSIQIPAENRIAKGDTAYISKWTEIARSIKKKLDEHGYLSRQNELLEQQLQLLKAGLKPATSLSPHDISDIHQFLDYFNFIWDHEFYALKKMIYHRYWKFAVGIVSHNIENISFLVYPIEYTSNEPLIQELDALKMDINNIFFQMNALIYLPWSTKEILRKQPQNYAYHLVQSTIKRTIGQASFPIDDEFLAHEYLYSFTNRFAHYFTLQKDQDYYNIENIRRLINVELPILIEGNLSFGDGITSTTHSIDQYIDIKESPQHTKRMEEARDKIRKSYIPAVNVEISSVRFDINLVTYYLEFLKSKGIHQIKRIYLPMREKFIPNHPKWHSWDKELMKVNLLIFATNFYRIYKGCLIQQFPHVEDELDLFENYDLLIWVLRHAGDGSQKPRLERYQMRSVTGTREKKILFYSKDDPDCPVDMVKMYEEKDWTCVVDGIKYEVVLQGMMPVDFLFEDSPTYSLMNRFLVEKIDTFFKERANLDH